MAERVGIEVSLAIAETAALCDIDVVSAYPITPQTHIVEHLAEIVADGRLDAEFIPVESEHTALSACLGASAAGARTYTSTSSQGLALMHEILFIASALRLPVSMSIVNRALSGPINIWNDHSDVMAERDTGWIQYFVENGQEAVDHTIMSFKVAEDPKVQLPVIVNLDGFILSHMVEPVVIPDKEKVDEFLPPFKPVHRLDVDKPVLMGPVGIPEIYTEAKWAQEVAIQGAREVIEKAWTDFERVFGRKYRAVETYRTDGADVIFVTMGAISETAMTFVDAARQRGEKVGLVRIRLWRPFPRDDFLKEVGKAACLIAIDRAVNLGGAGCPVALELKSVLYDRGFRIPVAEFVAGLGGRDVTLQDFGRMLDESRQRVKSGKTEAFKVIQVRE